MIDRLSQPYVISGIPAKWVDDLLLKSHDYGYGILRFGLNGTARLVSTVVFPIFALADTIIRLPISLIQRTWSFFAWDDTSRKYHRHLAGQNWEIVKKCFFGILGSPMGLVHPDIATVYFIPSPSEQSKITPYGGLYSAEAKVEFPETTQDVLAAFAKAKAENLTISVAGARMSQGGQQLPVEKGMGASPNIMLDLGNINHVYVDPSRKAAIVGAGATWCDIQDTVDKYNLAVKVSQASNVFTFGGSLGGANCHGWDHHYGTLGNTINWLTVVDADGVLHERLTKYDWDPKRRNLYKNVIGGYGFSGVIIEGEISLADNHLLTEKGQSVPLDQYATHFNTQVRDNPTIAMHLGRLPLTGDWNQVMAVDFNINPAGNPNNGSHLVDEPERGTRFQRVIVNVARHFAFVRSLYWKWESGRLRRGTVCTRNEAMRPPINGAINFSRANTKWLQEYFVPGEQLAPFVRNLQKTLKDHNVVLLNASIRYVKKDEISSLPYAKTNCFAVVLFFNQSLSTRRVEETRNWTQKVTDDVISKGGTFYLPYHRFARPDQIVTCYPELNGIFQYQRENYPRGVLNSGFQQHLQGAVQQMQQIYPYGTIRQVI